MLVNPSEAYRVYVGLVRETEGRYFWLMQWNLSWKETSVALLVIGIVGGLVFLHRLPPEVFYTLAVGLLMKQPVSGMGQKLKDSLRPPALPPEKP